MSRSFFSRELHRDIALVAQAGRDLRDARPNEVFNLIHQPDLVIAGGNVTLTIENGCLIATHTMSKLKAMLCAETKCEQNPDLLSIFCRIHESRKTIDAVTTATTAKTIAKPKVKVTALVKAKANTVSTAFTETISVPLSTAATKTTSTAVTTASTADIEMTPTTSKAILLNPTRFDFAEDWDEDDDIFLAPRIPCPSNSSKVDQRSTSKDPTVQLCNSDIDEEQGELYTSGDGDDWWCGQEMYVDKNCTSDSTNNESSTDDMSTEDVDQAEIAKKKIEQEAVEFGDFEMDI